MKFVILIRKVLLNYWRRIMRASMRDKFVLLFLLMPISMLGQIIQGKVLSYAGEPVGFANVMILNKTDSSFVCGTVTDSLGRFSVRYEKECLVKVSCIGYDDFYSLPSSDKMTVRLKSSVNNLSEVVVKSNVPRYTMTNEGVLTNVAGTILGKIGTAEDVLKHIPSVYYKNGKWEVFGKGTSTVYLNGRKLRDLGELSNIKSSDVKSVEIVNNPGARYSASVNAVIKIKTIPARGEGFSFDTYTNYEYNKFNNFIQRFTTSYRNAGLECFFTYKFVTTQSLQDAALDQTIVLDTLWNIQTENYYSEREPWHYLQGGLSYSINENHSIGIKYSTTLTGYQHNSGWLSSKAYENAILSDETYTFTKDRTKDKPIHRANVYYYGNVGKTVVDFNTDYYSAKPVLFTWNTEKSNTSGNREVDTRSYTHNRMLASSLELTTPLSFGQLVYGAEYISTKRSDDYESENVEVVGNSSSTIKENSFCPYVEFNCDGKIGQFSVGLRYENTGYKYYEGGSYKENQSKHFNNLFPSISFSKQNGDFAYQLQYSVKTQRPSYSQLSNNISYANRFLRQTGNPLLKHQIDHVLTAALTYKFLQASLEYKDSKDAIIYCVEQLQDNPYVSMIKYKNQKSIKSATAYLSLSPTIGFWSPQLNCGLTKPWLKLDVSGKTHNLDKPLLTLSLDNGFSLPWGITANLDYSFVSKGNYQNVEMVKCRNVVDISLQKSFLENKLSVELKGNDLFYGAWDSGAIYSSSTVFQQICRRASRSVELTLKYRYNTAKSKYKGSGAGRSELDRF